MDKSALVVASSNELARKILNDVADDDRLATNSVVALEVLFSAQNQLEYRRTRKWLEALNDLGLGHGSQRRAIDLQSRLAAKGAHRIPVTDLLIAADAEQNDVELLHYDKHFDMIARVSDLRARWIVPCGTGH